MQRQELLISEPLTCISGAVHLCAKKKKKVVVHFELDDIKHVLNMQMTCAVAGAHQFMSSRRLN